MAVVTSGAGTVMHAVNTQKKDMRTQAKTNLARLNDLQTQASATSRRIDGLSDSLSTKNLTVTSHMTAPNGNTVFGWSGASGLPTLTTDSNSGSSWAVGERSFINNLNTVVNFILTVLEDNGMIVP